MFCRLDRVHPATRATGTPFTMPQEYRPIPITHAPTHSGGVEGHGRRYRISKAQRCYHVLNVEGLGPHLGCDTKCTSSACRDDITYVIRFHPLTREVNSSLICRPAILLFISVAFLNCNSLRTRVLVRELEFLCIVDGKKTVCA